MKTRKILAAFISTFLIAGAAAAQDGDPFDTRNIMQIGITGGFNYSNLYDTRGEDFMNNSIFGPVFGGFLSVPIGPYLGIQPEVLYSGKGYEGTGVTGEGEEYSFVDRMNFLDVPIMLQLKPAPSVYFLGGPEYSYLLSRSYTFTQGITSETTQQQFQNDNIRHNIFGLMFGIDLNLSRNLTLGGRMAWDLQDNNGDGTSTLPRYRSYWGQATLGYRF